MKKINFFFKILTYRKINGKKKKKKQKQVLVSFIFYLSACGGLTTILTLRFISIYRKFRLLMSSVMLPAFEDLQWHHLHYRLSEPYGGIYFLIFTMVWDFSTNWVLHFYWIEVDDLFKNARMNLCDTFARWVTKGIH